MVTKATKTRQKRLYRHGLTRGQPRNRNQDTGKRGSIVFALGPCDKPTDKEQKPPESLIDESGNLRSKTVAAKNAGNIEFSKGNARGQNFRRTRSSQT